LSLGKWEAQQGPNLPGKIIEEFQNEVAECSSITSSDIVPLGEFARSVTRMHQLDFKTAADEFYKLALECGLDTSDARSVRNAVRKGSY
jgi:hypothetical protein